MNDAAHALPATVEPLVMSRDFDARRLNAVVNDPRVKSWVMPSPVPEAPLDLSPVVRNPANVALMSDLGGALFVALDDTCYELHTQFLPEARGRRTVAFMHEALAYMFTHTMCMEVVTKIPVHNVAAAALAQHFKFALDGTKSEQWPRGGDLPNADVNFMGYRWSDWIRYSPLLAAKGAEFHARLDSEAMLLDPAHVTHAPDLWHDRVVGATLMVAFAGLVDKAAILYNRWARFTGYVPVTVAARVPPMLDFGNLRIVLVDGQVEVVTAPPAPPSPVMEAQP